MRLTLSTLPQLAVLAKILCLLMVVMCGAVPAMVRSVSLYSTCSSGNITVSGRTVKALARDEYNAPFQKLTTQSDDFSRKLYIFAEKSQRYICFNKRWKPVALPKKQRDAMCQFYETYNGPYLRYKSAVNGSIYLGFNKYGKPIKGQRGRAECFNFMKFNPSFSINEHNDWMTGNADHTRRDLLHRKHHHQQKQQQQQEPQHQQQQQQFYDYPQQQHRQLGSPRKKNYLQADQVPRESATQHHRHRHTNRLKPDDLLRIHGPRRRHPGHLFDVNKY